MKALSLFSGGLDSMLAAELIRAQGIKVLGLFFETPFFTSPKAKTSAKPINLPIRVVNIATRHLEVVRSPKHGYGENMNPCIDCHALMIRKAGEMLEEEGASFIITGEVLGQRPMSQHKKALSTVAVESGNDGFVLRPLSALLLPITIPEEKGWVKRGKLMGFSGRSRKPQMELAKKLGIQKYPSPAGGCLLTDGSFSRRLRDLFSSGQDVQVRDLELLKLGRHLRIGPHSKLIVGRNKTENQAILSLSREEDITLTTLSVPGPSVLVIGDLTPDQEEMAVSITVSYSDAEEDVPTEVQVMDRGTIKKRMARSRDKREFRRYMIQEGITT